MHGVAHISGETNPNKLLTDVKKAGKHVQIIRANCRTKYNSNPGNGNTSDEIHGYGNGYEGSYHGKKEMDSYGYGYGSSSYDYNQAPSQPRLTYPKPHNHRKQLTLYKPRTERVRPPLRQGSPRLLSLEYGDPHHDPNYYSSRAIVPRYP
ncbi:hypothetical protein O6P43_007288 [Quillaja saponaria]|uniref:Uncharacterized protein n=1 Tax=Quillaja saponaria TaxID=32244 RepID=A0AAD7QA43_QUISA|nr:hypothetical protein O6P43_007288 [Quillaja saponaria]